MKRIIFFLIIPFLGLSQNDSLQLDEKLAGKTGIEVQPSVAANEPLFVVDGKIVDKATIEAIHPDDIDSITILKDKNAVEKYGDAGKNGVVEIYMKKKKEEVSVYEKLENKTPHIGLTSNEIPEIFPIDSIHIPAKQKFPGTVCQGSIRSTAKPNIVVNGELVSEEFLRNLDPNSIESVQVIKNADEVFCHQNINGTILIKTKNSSYEYMEYDLAVLDLGYESFLAMQPSAGTYSLNYLKNKNRYYVSVWNSRVMTGNPDIYDMPIEYDSKIYYGLEFEYKLYQYFKFIENKHHISFI